jgi:FkbM family methyltransferase
MKESMVDRPLRGRCQIFAASPHHFNIEQRSARSTGYSSARMKMIKDLIRSAAAQLGYEIRRQPVDAFADMRRFVPPGSAPVIFDIGANVGQSVKMLKAAFPNSVIHSFEPGRETFARLRKDTAQEKNVFAWNCAVGSTMGEQLFQENSESDMSSFLELSKAGWGEVKHRQKVAVATVDRFLADHAIGRIDILKSDTQGYELEVFRGAEQAMCEHRIGLIYFEFIFAEIYKNLPPFDEVYRYLIDRDFLLVAIYNFHRQNDVASWADVLFVNRDYYERSRAMTH